MSRINSQDRINEKLSPRRKRKGGKAPFIISFSAAAVVVVLVIVASALGQSKSDNPTDNNMPSGKNVVITPENVKEVIKDMEDKKVAPGTYNVKMNPTWTFETGSVASKDAYVENAATNNNDVRFTITRKDTEEEIYSSPIIPLGSRLANITLDTALPAGSHDCIITYHLLDENGEDVSSVKLSLTITVEK